MSLAPKDTVLILKKLGHKIEPLSVLPYLIFPSNVLTDNEVIILLFETKWKKVASNLYFVQAVEIISYLEYCIHSLHCHDEPIHNYLITLYAKQKPDKILQYLATQGKCFILNVHSNSFYYHFSPAYRTRCVNGELRNSIRIEIVPRNRFDRSLRSAVGHVGIVGECS